MGVFFKNPFVGQDLYFVYFGLSRTLTESNRPRIFTEEVLHMKEQYQCKGQARDRARANIGPTMRPASWLHCGTHFCPRASPPFYATSVTGKNLRPNFVGIFWDNEGGESPLLLRKREDYAAPRPPPRVIWHGHRHQHSIGMDRGAIFIINNNITNTTIIPSEIDGIALIVCVDRNPRSSLLNLVCACTWGFKIIL
jgi:hypothetical protein